MKSAVKMLLPPRLLGAARVMRCRLAIWTDFRLDRLRYTRYCIPGEISGNVENPRHLEAQLIKDYHRIEKGLALKDPRRPFGIAVAERIDANIASGNRFEYQSTALSHAIKAREALNMWNSEGLASDEIAPIVDQRRSDLEDVDSFFRSRHSIRDYDSTPVSDEIRGHAVELALQSPSVCNRQAWNIRFFDGDEVEHILAFQNGNRGFSSSVPLVCLITVDARMFAGTGERNQPWIEGGIFAMSLVWAFHALGVDSCMLNMSLDNTAIATVRREFNLMDYELVVMMIAAGYARDGHRVARSPRRHINEVIVCRARSI